MKKRVALLAMATMLALTPVAAFAGSDNGMSKKVNVKDDAVLFTSAPELKIENDGGDWDNEETIELKLTNAEWLDNGDETITNFETELAAKIKAATDEVTVGSTVYGVDVVVERKTDSKIKVTATSTQAGNIAEDIELRIPMWVEMDGEGEATVEIVSKDGSVSEEEIVFATGASGDTIITIEDTTDFSNTVEIEAIEIEETAEGTIVVGDLEYIELEVTKDFTFSTNSGIYGKISGDFGSFDIDPDNVKLDDETLKIYLNDSDETDKITLTDDESGIKTLEISELYVKPTNDADEGTVYVTLRSNLDEIDTTKLEVGKFAEYSMTVEADDDPAEIYNGQYEEATDGNSLDGTSVSTDAEEHELTMLNIEEDVIGTWDANKEVTVELPDWVKIMDVEIEGDSKDDLKDVSIDGNEFEFTVDSTWDDTKTKGVELTFYVSVEAGKTGDIDAKVSGRALDKEEFEVVLGKAMNPVEIKAEVAKLKAGVREQEVGKITITEATDGMIKEGQIVVELDDDLEWDEEPTIEVTKGDIEIDEDDIEIEDNILTITVTEESDEASVIEITDAKVKVDRSISEGGIEVEVKGDAIIRNGFDKDDAAMLTDDKSDAIDYYGYYSNDEYATIEVANVITPADDNTTAAEPAKFVIGNGEYVVGEEVKVADVAPYIKDGRTMLSLRYVAEAMGVEDNNIMWDGSTRTVTIFKGDRIAQVQIGSNKMMVNGTPIIMDTVAEIKDGRTMLPVSFVAKALGAEVEWDGATRTVTIK
ncbi:copper amine oxidase N-terminal domain-containing protein [Anaeromicrobium sediminis]|nr:copper amine oxidase N-terminal domain-containing protein [Anaeromicrobium sediminis]